MYLFLIINPSNSIVSAYIFDFYLIKSKPQIIICNAGPRLIIYMTVFQKPIEITLQMELLRVTCLIKPASAMGDKDSRYKFERQLYMVKIEI